MYRISTSLCVSPSLHFCYPPASPLLLPVQPLAPCSVSIQGQRWCRSFQVEPIFFKHHFRLLSLKIKHLRTQTKNSDIRCLLFPGGNMVFVFFFKIQFYLFMRDRERQRYRGRGRSRLPAGNQGSWPEPKADAQPLSHPGAPGNTIWAGGIPQHVFWLVLYWLHANK